MSTGIVPLFSAAAVNAPFDLSRALDRVLKSHSFVLGQEVKQFEAEFAAYTGVAHCVSVANGTDALELALHAVGVQRGDAVVCVANAGFYSATAIHLVGAEPTYVDVDADSLCMSATALANALQARPRAVIATHLYGQLADIETLARLCRDAGIPLIEDCAQAHGASRGAGRAGSFGDISCFSFYPTKNLGALGDGGAVLTNSAPLAASVAALRQYGWGRKYEVTRLGGRNSRLDEIQAAILREKLPALDLQNSQRREIARRYGKSFSPLPLRLPFSVGDDYVAHLYVVRCESRDDLRAHLTACGVATDVHYPISDIRQPAFGASRQDQSLPATEDACRTALTLPCFPGMADAQVDHVVASVTSFFERPRA